MASQLAQGVVVDVGRGGNVTGMFTTFRSTKHERICDEINECDE
jgi:hypothetical protein